MKWFLHTVAAVLYGLTIPPLVGHMGYLTRQAGIDYYAQVHPSALNSYVHTIFMPFTIYGMFLWLPRVFDLSLYDSIHFDTCIYVAYMTHYLMISRFVGLLACAYYFVPLVGAYVTHMRVDMSKLFYLGVGVSTLALLIQEVFGHWYSGDPPSRGEGVFNAILYAVYYSVHHVVA